MIPAGESPGVTNNDDPNGSSLFIVNAPCKSEIKGELKMNVRVVVAFKDIEVGDTVLVGNYCGYATASEIQMYPKEITLIFFLGVTAHEKYGTRPKIYGHPEEAISIKERFVNEV